MRTIKEKYKKVNEGSFTKAQFLRDVRMELPGMVSSGNNYQDTISILKNKGIIQEQEDVLDTNISPEQIRRGLDYELEKVGIFTPTESPTEEQYEKAREKAIKNLTKNPLFYLGKLADQKIEKKSSVNNFKEVKKGNMVDKENGLKKSTVKESVNLKSDKLSSSEYQKAKKMKGFSSKDWKWDSKQDLYVKNKKAVKEEYPDEDYERLSREVEFDISAEKEDSYEDEKDLQEAGKMYTITQILKLAKKVEEYIPDAAEELKELGAAYGDKIPADRVKGILKNYDLTQFKLREGKKLTEGRRAKIKGGKKVTESDYESGGYVEVMNPTLDKAINSVIKVWNEWKDAPATEPEMIPHAKSDVVKYFTERLEQEIKEQEGEEESSTITDQLEEMFTKKIVKLLTEQKTLISEAKAENLEKFVNYENPANDDLASRVRKGATELANHIYNMEKTYNDSREKIESVYENIGPFMSPGVATAFKKDLEPVLQKYMNIAVPKSQKIPREVNESRKTKYTKRK